MTINADVQDTVNAALERAQKGQAEEAMSIMMGLQQEYPLNHDVAFGIGSLHAFRENHKEAIQWFEKATAIFPYCIETQFNKALAYQKLGDLPNCVRAYREVIALGEPYDPIVKIARSFIADFSATILRTEDIPIDTYLNALDKFNRAFQLMSKNDWQGALDEFRASAAIHNRNAPCHGNMGLCLAFLGHKAEALIEIDRAIAIDSEYEPAISNRPTVEQMEEGLPLNTTTKMVNHALESFMEKRK